MQEALTFFTHYLFDELGLRRLEVDINPDNVASARVLTKAGFIKEGLLRHRWEFDGAVNDSEIYGLLKSDLDKARD